MIGKHLNAFTLLSIYEVWQAILLFSSYSNLCTGNNNQTGFDVIYQQAFHSQETYFIFIIWCLVKLSFGGSQAFNYTLAALPVLWEHYFVQDWSKYFMGNLLKLSCGILWDPTATTGHSMSDPKLPKLQMEQLDVEVSTPANDSETRNLQIGNLQKLTSRHAACWRINLSPTIFTCPTQEDTLFFRTLQTDRKWCLTAHLEQAHMDLKISSSTFSK